MIPVETTNSVGMILVLIPPGDFLMGSTDAQVEQALAMADQYDADQRVARGSNWSIDAVNCRSAFRNSYLPTLRFYSSGFRCARDLQAGKP